MTTSSTTSWKEPERIRVLHDLEILDTPPEERFDRLTRLARRLFDVPIALVSLVDTDRQWFKSNEGLDVRETPREWSFCAHAVSRGTRLVVPDALEDDRFRDNPLVQKDPSIRFYAGQPISAPGGVPLGTLCIIDRKPRELTPDDEELLSDLAEIVEQEFAALRLATVDELTGLTNRRGFNLLAEQSLAVCQRMERPVTLVMFDLNEFKQLNDERGHAAGDRALASFGAELLASYRESDVVSRLGGDEFCVLLSGTDAENVPLTLEKLATRIDARNEGRDSVEQIRFSVGVASFDAERHKGLDDLLAEADEKMYKHKRERR